MYNNNLLSIIINLCNDVLICHKSQHSFIDRIFFVLQIPFYTIVILFYINISILYFIPF